MPTSIFKNIPEEMRGLNQWVMWKYEEVEGGKPTKVPYSPLTGHLASVTNPSSWGSFTQALQALPHCSGIGFVFTENDPYTGIDLDFTQDEKSIERQTKIFKEFDSYSELSPSGKGLHIIIKAKLETGRRRSSIEIYSSSRFFTMTGQVYHNVGIADRQDLATVLWSEMGKGSAAIMYGGDFEEKSTDEEVINQALSAYNGDKFRTLLQGRWNEIYPSQSEADFAFIDIIAFYTQNRNQIARLFRNSALGQRAKAQRADYVQYMTNKAFDRMLPPVDIDGLRTALEEAIAAKTKVNDGVSYNGSTPDFDSGNLGSSPRTPAIEESPYTIPPGLLGEIASFIYQSSVRPVPETALAAAIALLAGVVGRSYNVSGTGLNQYVLLLAETGNGKEGMAAGISKLMNSIRNEVPAAKQFIGPAEIASGQALLKFIGKSAPSFVSIVGEFGLKMQQLSSLRANAAELMLKRVLLDLYNKSGKGNILHSSIYSQKENNTELMLSPALSLLGESTPETFFNAIDESIIADGLLPRFTLIEYTGKRPPMNYNHAEVQPSRLLIDQFATVCAYSLKLNLGTEAGPMVIDVVLEPEADAFLKKFDKYADDQINSTKVDVIRHLWNRAHLKAIKLAALVAVGVNPMNPVITLENAKWAHDIINHDIKKLMARFVAGNFGKNSEETKQVEDMKRVITQYVTGDKEICKKYGTEIEMFNDKVVPYAYINKRLASMASYRHDRQGATGAIKRVLMVLVDCDLIKEIPKQEMLSKYKSPQRAFMVSKWTSFVG